VTIPDVLLQAHSASLGLTLLPGKQFFRRTIAGDAFGRGAWLVEPFEGGPATRSFRIRLKGRASRPANTRIFVTGFRRQ